MPQTKPDTEEDVGSEISREVDEPPLYKVLLLNDDYTTMEFVVSILRTVFHKNEEEAVRIMMNVHKRGIGVCGIYTYEIAETKVDMVHALAVEHGFPLKCTMEKE